MGVPAAVRSLLDAAQIRLEQRGGRADVVLDSPGRRNAQTPATWRALAAVAEWLDGAADVVVLRGSGPSFSAGLDRRAFTPQGVPGEPSLSALARLDDAALDSAIRTYQDGFACWATASFLSVAAVQGHAIGAGFQLALACDLRIAAQDVQFAMREPSLGLVPDLGGTKPLVAAVGYARALEICATGRAVGSAEALAHGLVLEVAPVGGLDATVDRLVEGLMSGDLAAVKATRALLREAAERTPAAQRAAERAAQIERLRRLP